MDNQSIEFNKKFGTEEQCRKYLYNLRWSKGLSCPDCNSKSVSIRSNGYLCNNCGYIFTLTSNTLFHKTHLSIDKWLVAIKFFTDNPYTASIKGIKDLLELSNYATARRVYNKLLWCNINPTERLQGTVAWGITVLNKYTYVYIAEVYNCKTIKAHLINFSRSNYSNLEDIKNQYTIPALTKYSSFFNIDSGEILEYHQMKRDSYYLGLLQEDVAFFKQIKDYLSDELITSLTCAINSNYNRLSFDEMLYNAVNLNNIPPVITPYEYCLENLKLPNIGYLDNKKRTD